MCQSCSSNCSHCLTEIINKPFLTWRPGEKRRGRWQLACNREKTSSNNGLNAVVGTGVLGTSMGNWSCLSEALCRGDQINKMKWNKNSITRQDKWCLNWDWSRQRSSKVNLGESTFYRRCWAEALRMGNSEDKWGTDTASWRNSAWRFSIARARAQGARGKKWG